MTPKDDRRGRMRAVGPVLVIAAAVLAGIWAWGYVFSPSFLFAATGWGLYTALLPILAGIWGALGCRRLRRSADGSPHAGLLRAGSILGWTAAALPPLIVVGLIMAMFVAGGPA